ncbi:MAG: penicillin-binding protein 2 [Candidatus Parcubacteria bacterium]|nr:MAG: penicillin-binding protein 2 [Candidatus Parcubacteria bacterium]
MIDEEILFQPRGKRVKTSYFKNQNIFLFVFSLIFLSGLIYFFYLQIFFKQKYLALEKNLKTITYFAFPPRGKILDSQGKTLAEAELTFDAYVDLNKIQQLPFQLSGKFFYRGSQLIIRDIPREIALNFLTKKIDGLEIVPSFKRVYLGHEEIGSLIGYVGFPSKNETKYYQEEFVGKSGLELVYQDYLRGELGEIVYQIQKNNLRKIKETQPQPGKNLVLTINYDFQKKAYELIDDYLRRNNYKKAAFIALNPNTGEIISLISYPSYDPNWFLTNPDKVNQILQDKNQPLFNRVVSGLYAPGSTIKLIVAAGALEEKIVSPETEIYAAGELRLPNPYFPGTYSIFKDNKIHGWTNIYRAIADSVNIYFYVVGGGYPYANDKIPIRQGLGIERLNKWWQNFGLGQKTGVDLNGEKSGFLPSPQTKAKNIFDPTWRLGDTYNVAIGQGDILVTPLQIALWTSAFTNNKIYQPFIVKKIIDDQGKIIFERQSKILKENLISEENLKIIQKAMRMTVTQGTAQILNDLPVAVAGKSGTPEIFAKKKLNAIFTGYFPFEKPEVVMTLLIEDVPSGSVATLPLYKELVKAYLESEHGRNF